MRPRNFTLAALLLGAAVAAHSQSLTEKYRPVADKLIDAALADDEGYKRLEYLTYRIGNRLSGSASLQKAIDWSVEQQFTPTPIRAEELVDLRFLKELRSV